MGRDRRKVEVRASRLIAAVPERVLLALTDLTQLARWCGAEAEVTASHYRLRGESFPTGVLGGRLLERSERGLRFEWPLGTRVSTVEITLEPVPQVDNPPADFTRVAVHHRGIPADVLPARWPEESWQCMWALWLRLLQGWLERAEALPRFSFRPPFGAVVERAVEIDAPPDRVWSALVDPAVRERWLTVPLGKELRREEGRLLVCAFELEQPATTVTWRLEALPGGRTRVTPPERVWPHVSTQEGLRRWFAGNIRIRPEVGSPVALGAHGGRLRGRVLEVFPRQLLRLSWTEEGAGWPEPEPLIITIELVPEGRGTRVYITHSGFENLPVAIRQKEFDSYRRGWADGDSLPALKEVAASA